MVLRSQVKPCGWTLQEEIDVEELYVEKAKEIIAKFVEPNVGMEGATHSSFLDFG